MKKIILLLTFFLSSCTNEMSINKFTNTEPKFILEKYFNGKTEAWGMFHDRFGNLKRSFKVDITGTLTDDELILDERFLYDDGEKEQRVWTIKLLGGNKYSGTADDVIGEAVGIAQGNALNWKYKLDLNSSSDVMLFLTEIPS